MKYELIEEVSIKDLEQMVRECNSYDGSLEEYDYFENGEEFFNVHFGNDILSAVRAVCFGEYEYSDDYVRVNDYGNLKSLSKWGYEDELEDNESEIIERYAEMLEDGEVSELKHLFKEVDDE